MILAKLEDGKLVFCPRNGYLKGTPISNIDIYFKTHPDEAKEEGWLPVVFLEEPTDNVKYIIENDVIYEIAVEECGEETNKDGEQTYDNQ